jgi:hypothetical protein
MLRPQLPAAVHACNRAHNHTIVIEQHSLGFHHHLRHQAPCQHKRLRRLQHLLHALLRNSRNTRAAAARSHSRAAAAMSPQHSAARARRVLQKELHAIQRLHTQHLQPPQCRSRQTSSSPAIALLQSIVDVHIDTRPYWCSPYSACSAATSSPSVFFSSAITFASSRLFSSPSRSGRCFENPDPPDSSPPIKMSLDPASGRPHT